MKKLIALLLSCSMAFGMVACGGNNTNGGSNDGNKTPTNQNTPSDNKDNTDNTGDDGSNASGEVITFEGDYTYNTWVSTLSSNWNPHTYETSDESEPISYLTADLYAFYFNDALHPVEGRNEYEGYVVIPEMAASEPVDVTEQIKKDHPEFGIPESATEGYAYTVDIRTDACWEDGTPITAEDYVESMKRLLDPKLQNYRAGDVYEGRFAIAGAKEYANAGLATNISIAEMMAIDGLADMDAFLAAHGEDEAYINWKNSFANTYDFSAGAWTGSSENEVVATGVTINELLPLFLEWAQSMNNASAETADGWSYDELFVQYTYPEVDFDTVGMWQSGDYQFTIVLKNALKGFNLLYNMSGGWLVKTDLYDSCIREDVTANGTLYSSTYWTSLENTMSYGPYKMSSYQTDKGMHFVKNENWYGYHDGEHVYVDPTDGKTYAMYQTTEVDYQVIAEVATAKMMFLKGEIMTYSLQSDDYDTYRNSEFCHFTPGQAVYFQILNGNMAAIKEREAASDFDQTKKDLETVSLTSFHRALGLTYDKQLYCDTLYPAQKPAYGLIGNAYIADPDTGATYRSTDEAKQVLCDVYGVDATKFATLDDAVASITGYDPVAAKEWYKIAFEEALAAGYITDNNGDGICDQTIEMIYNASATSEKVTKVCDYLTEKANEVTAGTPFEGKISIVVSAPLGNAWADNCKGGLTDLCMGGWSGSGMDPFGLMDVYTNPAYQYDRDWFDASAAMMTLTIDGREITMSLTDWTHAMNGETVTIDGVDYNYGSASATQAVRTQIMAGIEREVLLNYNYLPFTEAGSMALLSQKAFYVVEDYNPVMGRGGVQYLRYNYNDTEWAEYVASSGGELTY